METCPHCYKNLDLCLCAQITPLDNRVQVLILQHPQEPDKELGSARLANLILRRSVLRTGFSVPNLAAVLGEAADPAEWIVLYLGSKYKFAELLGEGAVAASPAVAAARSATGPQLLFFDRKDEPVSLDRARIKGVVAIDGTWAQAKALWWRNPWLLKLTRAVVLPNRPSLYGRLRREPRAECVSTIEAIAATLEVLGENPAVPEALRAAFAALIGRYSVRQQPRAGAPAQPGAARSQVPAGDTPSERPLTRAEKAAAARKASTGAIPIP